MDFSGGSRDFRAFEDGIYYGGPPEDGRTPILFHHFATGKSRLLTRIEGVVFRRFRVSPDRKAVLFAKTLDSGPI